MNRESTGAWRTWSLELAVDIVAIGADAKLEQDGLPATADLRIDHRHLERHADQQPILLLARHSLQSETIKRSVL